jgi:hypothetical protein
MPESLERLALIYLRLSAIAMEGEERIVRRRRPSTQFSTRGNNMNWRTR